MVALLLISGCALLHKRLPYRDPDRLVTVVKVTPAGEEPVLDTDILELLEQSRTLGQIAAYVPRHVILTDGGDSERISATLTSADLFSSLGVAPMLGRAIISEECHPGGNHVAPQDEVVLVCPAGSRELAVSGTCDGIISARTADRLSRKQCRWVLEVFFTSDVAVLVHMDTAGDSDRAIGIEAAKKKSVLSE